MSKPRRKRAENIDLFNNFFAYKELKEEANDFAAHSPACSRDHWGCVSPVWCPTEQSWCSELVFQGDRSGGSGSSLLALHQLVKPPHSRTAPWLDPESCLGRFLCQHLEFEGILACGGFIFAFLKAGIQLCSWRCIPPLYIWLLLNYILG